MGPDAMIFVFWMLSFKPTFKKLFSSSSLSAIRVMSYAYLRLLIFFPEILTPACASFSPGFPMMYSAYKLSEQGDNIQPWRTPSPILNQSVVWYLALTCLLTYIQVSLAAGKVVWFLPHNDSGWNIQIIVADANSGGSKVRNGKLKAVCQKSKNHTSALSRKGMVDEFWKKGQNPNTDWVFHRAN